MRVNGRLHLRSQIRRLHCRLCIIEMSNTKYLKVSSLDSELSESGVSQDYCFVFLGKTLYSHSASINGCTLVPDDNVCGEYIWDGLGSLQVD